jgi:biotin operon repressor
MMGDWTFFSNYGHVLVCLSRNREARLRDVAAMVGITERAVQKIVRDLQDEGFLTVTKQGRCNRYRINRRKSLRHELESHVTVGKLLTLLDRPSTQRDPVLGADDAVQAPVPESAKPPEETSSRQGSNDREDAGKPDPDEKASRKKNVPVDTRQQGSLF